MKRMRLRIHRRRRLGGFHLGGVALATAAATYYLDPDHGARRRAIFVNRLVHARCASAEFASKANRDFANRARGLAWRLRRFGATRAADPVLIDRVRAVLGRTATHPHTICVSASDGVVTVSGPILAQEKRALLSSIRRVRGVRKVEDALDVYHNSERVPSLQGGRRLPDRRRRFELGQQSWTPSLRVAAGAAGIALGALALGRRKPAGALTFSLGTGLFLRALTNLPFRRLVGVGAGRRAIDVHKTISVAAPIEEVFALFSSIDRFPKFMEHVRAVRMLENNRSHWTVVGPAGAAISFDVEITKITPNETVSWRTVEGSAIGHEGTVLFEEQPDGSTRLDVRMSYNPVAGAVGHAVARWFGVDPKKALDDDLVRLKSLLEDGKTRAHHEPVARDDVLRSPTLH